MSSPDLSTTYLGLHLANPFMTGASPLADHLDTARRLEDAGCSAIVLHSLFEEQISQADSGRIRHLDPLDRQFAAVISYFPEADTYALGPDEYLEHLKRLKDALSIPVIGSLNGTTAEAWLKFGRLIEQAGADAVELNTYEVVTEAEQTGLAVEGDLRQIVVDLKRELRIPIAVKLSPYFTALANVGRELERAGASALVMFNRFLQPDIDVRHLAVWPRLELSTSAELLIRLRWLAIMRNQVRCSLAASGGVATPNDAIKALLAGADVVQLVSAILRGGPSCFVSMQKDLRRWMETLEFARIDDFRGRVSMTKVEDRSAFERAQYIRTLGSWSAWLGYQAYVQAHEDDEANLPS